MSDTSRKRSRKSKLVPRECAVGEDEFDLELQMPYSKLAKIKKENVKKVIKTPEPIPVKPEEVCDTSVLKKINASAVENIKSKSSPRKFEINIEIETCDDEEEIAENNEDGVNTDKKTVMTLKKTKKVCPFPIVLSREIVLEAADEILKTSTNFADKILNINVRNTIGYEQPDNLNQGWIESQIQEALDVWKTWQLRSYHRDAPLFYKCYICKRSYWYLSEFRDHMSAEHANDKTVNISLEKYEMHEANMIAYHEKHIVIIDIYTPGLCYRCGKDYNAHELELRIQKKYYKHESCTKQFFTCMSMTNHFPWCFVCKVKNKPLHCKVCKLRFDTEDDLNSHMLLSHCVRSDIPIGARYKNCKQCEQRFCCSYLHKCGDPSPHSECPHCLRSFSSRMAMEIHMERSIVPYKCEICNVVMNYSCQKYDHMLSHTDKYMKVKKCIKCEGLNVFLNNDNALAHRVLKHDSKDTRQLSYFPNILIPSACQYLSLPEPAPTGKDPVPTNQEPVPTNREPVPIDQGPVPTDQGPVPTDKEPVPTGEKELARNEKELVSESEEAVSESELESGPLSQQTSTQEEEESTMDSVVVKEEPQDSEGPEDFEELEDSEDSPRLIIKEEPLSPRLVIKEEMFEAVENEIHARENQTDNFEHRIVKEEIVEEEEYDENIVNLDFNIEDLLVKQESTDEDEYILLTSDDAQELDDDESTQESLPQLMQKKQSISKAKIPLRGDKRQKRLYRCTACGYTANHRSYREHIDYDCRKNPYKSYGCTKCDKKFTTMKKYLGHFEEHGYKRLSCPECQKMYNTYTILGHHLQTHIKQNFVRVKLITYEGGAITKPDYQCRKCGETVPAKKFFEHWELHVNDRPIEPVKVTARPSANKDDMREDMVKDCVARLTKQPKECNLCHHRFKRVNECKRHIIEHLLTDAYKHKLTFKELRCQVCDAGFPNPEKYKQHMRDHASLPVYKCELCDRTFSDSSNFTKHKKVHNLKVIVCDLCGKKFQSKISLEKHLEKHQTTEPITCKICNKIFYFESSYRRHVRYFHEKTTYGFRCVICSERFDSLKFKWDHMWEVHKERKQNADCPICHKSYRKYSDVRAHARKDHSMEISVLSVKKTSKPRSMFNIDEFLKNKQAKHIKLSKVETLVVYDSD